MTPENIKSLVEQVSGLKDISVKNRKMFNVDVRCVYFQLCDLHLDRRLYTLHEIGKSVNLTHATVIYGLKRAKLFIGQKCFLANDIYKEAEQLLIDLYKDKPEPKGNEIKAYFLNKIDRLHIHYQNEINRLKNENNRLKIEFSDERIEMINALSKEDYNSLLERIDIFLKVNQKLKR